MAGYTDSDGEALDKAPLLPATNSASDSKPAENEEEVELTPWQVLLRLLPYNVPTAYLWFLLFGLISVPTASVLLIIVQMEIMVRFIADDAEMIKTKMRVFLPVMLAFLVVVVLVQSVARYCMFHLTFNMVKTLRMNLYDNMIRLPTKFYDKEDHSAGNLVSVLVDDIKYINGASLELYALFFQGVVGMMASTVVALAY